MTIFLFPGQGSQHRGMGTTLFDEVGEFAAFEPRVDAVLGYSVRRLCLLDADDRLKETRYTQPALYVVNALHYFKARAQGRVASFAAGHSLGEYSALFAAGAFDFLTGLRLVQKRGELMAQAKNGTMAAIIGLPANRIAQVLRDAGLPGLDVANFNSPSQTVISGPVAEITRAQAPFEKAGARAFMPLPVSAAFHSRYMLDAAREFADFLGPFTFSPLRFPVIANVTGEPYPTEEASRSIKSLLVQQITHSVRWAASMTWLLGRKDSEFLEVGPGNVLTRLLQQIQQTSAGMSVLRGVGT